MDTRCGIRCDGCGRLDPLRARRFTAFTIMGRYQGEPFVVMGADSAQAILHSCPGCFAKIEACMKISDFHGLPDGPLKKALRAMAPSLRLDPPKREDRKPS